MLFMKGSSYWNSMVSALGEASGKRSTEHLIGWGMGMGRKA